MKKLVCLTLFSGILLSLNSLNAQSPEGNKRNLQKKEVFTKGYPKTLLFRNDKTGLNDGYDYWEKIHFPFNAITKKYLQEEVDMPLVIAEWANKYVEKHPEKLMLIHLNGEGRSVNDEDIHQLYFPGHWMYEEGSFPVEDIDKKQKTIVVQNAQLFSEKAYAVHGRDVRINKLPHDIILVELDENGNRLWNTCEFATIKKVDYGNNRITIQRGKYKTNPRDFKKGSTYIAPIAGDHWGGNLMWYYNFSATCPLDENGNSAADVFVNEMKNWFGPRGILKNIDGIGFDVNYFETDHKTWDCNNDGKADRGIIDGKNIWRLGDIDFLKKIRTAFGDEFIITADGWRDEMQRAIGIMNGMETEGLCRWNDGYRQISRTINQHTYWNLYNDTKYKYSYITSKLRNPLDEKIAPQLHRMGLGLASCLGVSYAYSPTFYIPEAFGGALKKANWLGEPMGNMKYAVNENDDLRNGAGEKFDNNLLGQFDFTGVDHKLESSTLYIKGKNKNPYEEIVVHGPEVSIASGDLIVFFEAKAIKGFTDLKNQGQIPRKINVRIEGLPEFPVEPMNTHELYNDLAGFMGTEGFTPQMFYFRNAGESENALKLIFEAEEQGEFAIRNLKIMNAPCAIVRDFENGVVLVNPSLQPFDFNLDQLLGTQQAYQRIKIVPPSVGKLDGNLEEITKYNNGEIVENSSNVTVPALNALFLIKTNK